MKKKEKWLLAALISVVVFIQAWGLVRFSFKPQSITHASSAEVVFGDKIVPLNSNLVSEQPLADVRYIKRSSVERGVAWDLELLGVAIGNIKDPVVFIKNLETGKRGMYKLGNLIQEARIIKIAKNSVTLEKNGKTGILKLGSRGRSWSGLQEIDPISISGDHIVVSKKGLLQQVTDIYKSVKNIKVKPHYQLNKVAGLIVDGIAQGSIIEAAGIRNNDVIEVVNNQKIDSYQKALQVFSKVKSKSEIKVCLLRDGQQKTLRYKITN